MTGVSPKAIEASAQAISEAYAIDADSRHVVAAPPAYRYSGLSWKGEGTRGRPRAFGLGFQNDGTLMLAFRGSAEVVDFLVDLEWREVPFDWLRHPALDTARGAEGFAEVYASMRDALLDIVARVRPERLHLAGHSLGGVLATYLCADLLLGARACAMPIAMTLWASPKPGNSPFAEALRDYRDSGQLSVTAFANIHDVVPKVPFKGDYLHPSELTWLDFGHPFDLVGNHSIRHYLRAYQAGTSRAGNAHPIPLTALQT